MPCMKGPAKTMSASFANSLKSLRAARGLSQQQLATKLYVDRSTVARWESGDRVPDLVIVPRIAEALSVETTTLLSAVQASEAPSIIAVDDEGIALAGAIAVLEKALPETAITGFTRPTDALSFAQTHPIAIAFLDIEMRHTSGLDLCRSLLETRPHSNVVFLTAYREYSFDAWETGACGFLLKPITTEAVIAQIGKLRYPVVGLQPIELEKPNDVQRTVRG